MALRERLRPVDRRGHQKYADSFATRLWQGYCLTSEEQFQIDQLMGRALLDSKFCERLLRQSDVTILADYTLSDETKKWLTSIEAANIMEFAQAISPENVRS